MKKPRLAAIDMDGTLLGSNGRVSERNLAALRRAEEAGIEVVIATGRRHSYALRVLRELGLNPANALVSSNGTVIRTVGSELMHRHHMETSTARWLCEHVAEFRKTMVITFDLVDSHGEDRRGSLVVESLEDLHASIGRWMDANEPYIAQVDFLEEALGGSGADPDDALRNSEPHGRSGSATAGTPQNFLWRRRSKICGRRGHSASHGVSGSRFVHPRHPACESLEGVCLATSC